MKKSNQTSTLRVEGYEASVSKAKEALGCSTNEELKEMCESLLKKIEYLNKINK